MKKNRLIVIIASLLAVLTIVLILTNNRSTIKQELKDFAVKDTGSIDKIFLANRSNSTILLERLPNQTWKVNSKYKARPDAVKLLLSTIASLQVQSPVAKAAYNNILKQLAGGGVKVEIYKKGTLSKTYYVGGPNQDQTGTFMLLENSSTPFVMEIPGFIGYLTPRYFTNLTDWRDKSLFQYSPEQIKSISVEYSDKKDQSFKIINRGDNSFVLASLDGATMKNVDTLKVRNYVAAFRRKNVENFISPANKDSVLKFPPFCKIIVNAIDGEKVVKLYMKSSPTPTDLQGNKLTHDMERMYGTINGENFSIVQFYMLNDILLFKDDFLNTKNKSKS